MMADFASGVERRTHEPYTFDSTDGSKDTGAFVDMSYSLLTSLMML